MCFYMDSIFGIDIISNIQTKYSQVAIIIFSILLGLVVILYYFFRPLKVDADLPGPKRDAIFGATFTNEQHLFECKEDQDFWSSWPLFSLNMSRQFKFRTWGAPTLNIGFGGAFFVICSPPELKHILQDNFHNYVKGKVARKCLREALGRGIFTADGNLWKYHRKFVVALMNKSTLEQGCVNMFEKLQEVTHVLDQAVESGELIDWQDLCFRMILDVFARIAFSIELDGVLHQDKHRAFTSAFNEIQHLCHQRFADLFWEIKQFFSLGQREKRILECATVIDNFAEEMINRIRGETMCTSSEEKCNVVTRYINYATTSAKSQVGEKAPTNKELRDFVMNFVLAGRDSTACALSWAMYELTHHPRWIDEIREEALLICGTKESSSEGAYNLNQIGKLKITHAVVMEALRLHPPVAEDFKFAVGDDVLPDGTRIPAGSCVMYSPYSINRNDNVWLSSNKKYPVDEFFPERFLNQLEPSAFAFPTFNAGQRTCPGKNLALMEIKMALVYLLPRYDFEDSEGHDGKFKFTLVTSMKGGFPIKVKKRSNVILETKCSGFF